MTMSFLDFPSVITTDDNINAFCDNVTLDWTRTELVPLRYSSRLGPLAAVAAGVHTNSLHSAEAGSNHSQNSNAGSATNIRLESDANHSI